MKKEKKSESRELTDIENTEVNGGVCYKNKLTQNEIEILINAIDDLQVNDGDKFLAKTMVSASKGLLNVLNSYFLSMVCKSNEWNVVFDLLQKLGRK